MRQPNVKKGVRFPFQTAICSWVDLLGYGNQIAGAGFNPMSELALQSTKRLRNFHKVLAQHSSRVFRTLTINDGAVAFKDLSYRSPSVTYDFLCRSWALFKAIQDIENKNKQPGCRMVIATGFRMRGRIAGIDSTEKHFQNLLTRLSSGVMGVDQALREARRIRPNSDVEPQLQANFAFTKAYVAEQSGAKGGLGGSNCFVELLIFKTFPLGWIKLTSPIEWKNEQLNLDTRFASINSITQKKFSTPAPPEVLDGLQIAQQLAGDENVLKTLKNAK